MLPLGQQNSSLTSDYLRNGLMFIMCLSHTSYLRLDYRHTPGCIATQACVTNLCVRCIGPFELCVYTIHTDIPITIGLKKTLYNVSEDAGSVQVCYQVLSGRTATRSISMQLRTVQGDATGICSCQLCWNGWNCPEIMRIVPVVSQSKLNTDNVPPFPLTFTFMVTTAKTACL